MRERHFKVLVGCILLLLAITSQSDAQFTTLADFQGSANGAEPFYGYPIVFGGGNGYGTTVGGGVYDEGTVFQVTPSGTLTAIYTFCSQVNCTDGAEPFSGLVVAGGNFYGTTYWGGAYGAGTVFEVTPAGQLTTLHSFAGGATDGAYPIAGLVQVGGNFYGTTQFGGANGAGTVFQITPAGQLTTLYSFCSQAGCTDGAGPYAGLVQATNGNLYGTTFVGGANSVGTVYEITPAGQLTTLYSFCSQPGCSDGLHPRAGLALASDGNLYGTTEGGSGPGLVYTFGTVFGMTPAGQVTTLHSFSKTDGALPFGGLVEGASGILYGATAYGGSQYNGTIFSLPVGLDLL